MGEEGCCVAVEEPGEFAVGGLNEACGRDEGVARRVEVLLDGVGLGGTGDEEDDVAGGVEQGEGGGDVSGVG